MELKLVLFWTHKSNRRSAVLALRKCKRICKRMAASDLAFGAHRSRVALLEVLNHADRPGDVYGYLAINWAIYAIKSVYGATGEGTCRVHIHKKICVWDLN